MGCSYPITLKRDGRHELVPCGKCIDCIQRKRADWSFRLLQESKISVKSTFLTLTYNETSINKTATLEKKVLQDYFKRVRSVEPKLKYYAVGEYGSQSKRPHYHAIVFNCDNDTLVDKWTTASSNHKDSAGFVTTDKVTEASIHYVTGYIVDKYGKFDEKTGKSIPDERWSDASIRPFSLMSKGLGKIYLKHNTKFHKSNFTTETTKEGGQKQLIPRYYRDRIFDENERKLLAEKLQEKMKNLQTTNSEEFQKRNYKREKVKHSLKLKSL